ncbi:MAG TPA: MaoC family dehydratase [Miltoncostaeaceae bacterium]|nr:MaoC family dehydratase [Miltoncostaeaceae bacterium]
MHDGPYYLDDLRVGQRFTTGEFELDADRAIAFARDWDPQPFHTDADAAADSFFGELVASGWHTAAITMRLLVERLPIAGGLIGAGGEISWPAPTRPGAVLHVEGEVLEVRPSRSRPDRGIAVVRMETVDREGAVTQVFTVTMVVPRRPGA